MFNKLVPIGFLTFAILLTTGCAEEFVLDPEDLDIGDHLLETFEPSSYNIASTSLPLYLQDFAREQSYGTLPDSSFYDELGGAFGFGYVQYDLKFLNNILLNPLHG